MDQKLVAVLESVKAHERRVPIHPVHFKNLANIERLRFQENYANYFPDYDSSFFKQNFSLAPRDQVLAEADVVFLLKPTLDDLKKMKKGATLVGWCHAVQQMKLARIAKEKQLTLIAMENMYEYSREGIKKHTFFLNNYKAGFLGVKQAIGLAPLIYEKNANVTVISYGAVSQGAVAALLELGFNNVTIFSRQKNNNRQYNKKGNILFKQIKASRGQFILEESSSFKSVLLTSEIIVNGIAQPVLEPYIFLDDADLKTTKGKLIIDISCDDKMGFSFSKATSLDEPLISIGEHFYYAVDNTPTLDWDFISIHLSEKLFPILNSFLSGKFDSATQTLLDKATDIKKGIVLNPLIDAYQALHRDKL